VAPTRGDRPVTGGHDFRIHVIGWRYVSWYCRRPDHALELGQPQRRQDRCGILWTLSWRCASRGPPPVVGAEPSWPRNRDMLAEMMSALVVANSAEKRRTFDYRRFCTGCASTVLSMRAGRVEREMGNSAVIYD